MVDAFILQGIQISLIQWFAPVDRFMSEYGKSFITPEHPELRLPTVRFYGKGNLPYLSKIHSSHSMHFRRFRFCLPSDFIMQWWISCFCVLEILGQHVHYNKRNRGQDYHYNGIYARKETVKRHFDRWWNTLNECMPCWAE